MGNAVQSGGRHDRARKHSTQEVDVMTTSSTLYSVSFGGRGCKVRVYEPREGANYMLPRFKDGRYHSATLGHRDPEKAKAEAYSLIASITSGKKGAERLNDEPETLTL